MSAMPRRFPQREPSDSRGRQRCHRDRGSSRRHFLGDREVPQRSLGQVDDGGGAGVGLDRLGSTPRIGLVDVSLAAREYVAVARDDAPVVRLVFFVAFADFKLHRLLLVTLTVVVVRNGMVRIPALVRILTFRVLVRVIRRVVIACGHRVVTALSRRRSWMSCWCGRL